MSDLENLFDAHTHHFDSKNRSIVQLSQLPVENLPAYFSFGIHPKQDGANWAEIEQIVEQLNQKTGFLAIGEIGLDNRYPAMEEQEKGYIFQLKLASRFQKPVILHCVNTWDRCRFLHEKYAPETTLIYHGFNKASLINHVLDYPKSIISIGESVISNPALQGVVPQIPVGRLLLETDTGSGELIDNYRITAEIKNVSLQALTEQLNQNAKRIFNYE
ncbi:putative deoxyribonuclease YjjV [compost metagenome]